MNLWLPTDAYLGIKRSNRFYRKPWAMWRSMKPHSSLQVGLCIFATDLSLIVDFSQVRFGKR